MDRFLAMTRLRLLPAYRLGSPASSWKRRGMQAAAGAAGPVHCWHSASTSGRTFNTVTNHGRPADKLMKWRFPVDDRMEAMMQQVHHGVITSNMILTFNAVTPITYELMEEALNILYDKVESLRLCFRNRENRTWVADMPKRIIDFEFVNQRNVEDAYSDLNGSAFDLHNGPLWKARFIASPENALCQLPEIKTKFPLQYDLLMYFHHAANDGVVTVLVAELLHNIIDHLLQGIPVDRQQVGELRDGVETRQEEARIKSALVKDENKLKAALHDYEMGKHVPLVIEAFGSPSEGDSSTYVFPPLFLDKDAVNRIVHKCRSLGITVNACITAIINASIVELIYDAGLKRNNYLITSVHPVDSRRLFKRSSIPYLGYHAIQMTLTMATPHDVKKHFWKYAQTLDTEFRRKLKSNWMCGERVLSAMMRPAGYSHEAHYSNPIPLCYDYMFSNLYSPENLAQGVGKCVQITSMVLTNDIHKTFYPLAFALFGFRGQVRLEAVHSTASIHREVGSKILEKSRLLLHDVSNNMN